MSANESTNIYAKAKYEAVELLIAKHQDEYESMFKQIKIKYGIKPRMTKAEKIAHYREAIARLESGEFHG
jgi:hypothetical protein